MVESLVSTIMEGRRSVTHTHTHTHCPISSGILWYSIEQKVTEDTALFKQGELGKAPEGYISLITPFSHSLAPPSPLPFFFPLPTQ